MKKLITLGLIVAGIWGAWMWGFERFYVHPDFMAIIEKKSGEALEPGQILARKNQKGTQADVLGEGRHFLNPIMYEWHIIPVLTILPGKIGIVTAKVGKDLPEGEFLANDDQKGIWRRVLGPGKYRMNPYGYNIEIADATIVPVGYAGVMTSLAGEQTPIGQFAGKGQKGVRKDILQPGLYYINPKEFKVDILEIGVNQVSLLGKGGSAVITKSELSSANSAVQEMQHQALQAQKDSRWDYISSNLISKRKENSEENYNAPEQGIAAGDKTRQGKPKQQELNLEAERKKYLEGQAGGLILQQFLEFPSRDGFQITLDMTVEIELLPAEIAGIFSQYGDLPMVVDKIIMPQITSVARNKGSEYGAKDFIMGEGREKFQTELTKTLQLILGQKKIIVHNALIRHVEVPTQILEPIQQASIAVEQDKTNIERQNTAKKLAELNTEQTMIEQKKQQVEVETEKLKAEIAADREKVVASTRADAIRKVAEIARDTAKVTAETTRTMATAQATSVKMVEGEKAMGLQLKAKGFNDPVAFGLWEFAKQLNNKMTINILHSGEGTLWTDLENATTSSLGGAAVLKNKK